MKPVVVIHYGEIGLKGRNREHFERILVKNLKKAVADLPVDIRRRYGRIVGTLGTDADAGAVAERLARVFGVENFAFGYETQAGMDAIAAAAVEVLRAREGPWDTFRVTATRSDKGFPKTSQEIGKEVGAEILKAFDGKKVKLKGYDAVAHVEVSDKAYVTGTKRAGAGGLPVGASGRVLVLLSGGLDSPVAAWYMAKRGCEVSFVHFHSMPYTDRASVEKIRELAAILSAWGTDDAVFEVPFAEIQREIVKETKGEYRVLLYRRFMMRIAETHAHSAKAKALVTGESLGQVASQTLENLSAVEDAVSMPILRPLIGMDKKEIIERAKAIDTYETSILPHGDCCSLFTPRYPATKARAQDLHREEAKLDADSLIHRTLSKSSLS